MCDFRGGGRWVYIGFVASNRAVIRGNERRHTGGGAAGVGEKQPGR